jgi:hypothetical protein
MRTAMLTAIRLIGVANMRRSRLFIARSSVYVWNERWRVASVWTLLRHPRIGCELKAPGRSSVIDRDG